MMCSVSYIPTRLHTNGRADLPAFEVGEKLYRRCPPKAQESPFESISLVDLSVNRTGPGAVAPLCQPTDVLYNFTPAQRPGERIEGEVVVALEIRELTETAYTYLARLPDQQEVDLPVCRMDLAHRAEPCNFAHCAFELRLNNELVTFENWSVGLGLKKYRHLRTLCRTELARMLIKGEVWITWPDAGGG